eukprot:15100307-Alexandrium_andersonii.AAC.1
MPEPYYIWITVRQRYTHGTKRILHPVVLPTDWLHALGKVPTAFQNILLGPPGSIHEYWMFEQGRPADLRHPFLSEVPNPDIGIPYAVHGDD